MKELIDVLSSFGDTISLVLIFILIKEQKRALNKNILVIIFSFIFFTSCMAFAILHELDWLIYVCSLFDASFFWVLGPLMLVYVKSIFFDNKNLIKKNLYHFLPLLLITPLVHIPYLYDVETDYLKFIFKYPLAYFIVRDFYFLFYMIFSVKLFLNLKKKLNEKMNISIKKYNWILKLLIACLAFASIDTFMRILEAFDIFFELDGGYITFLAIIFFLSYLGYYSINEATFIVPSFLIDDNKKANPNFSKDEAILIEQKIKEILELEKLFLDENLTLKKLSNSLEISEKKLSMFLNNHMNTKFSDYVNFYRVEAVKEKLKSEEFDKLTLVAISEECGFNSKASFYRIFKKHTGISPAQYKKSIK